MSLYYQTMYWYPKWNFYFYNFFSQIANIQNGLEEQYYRVEVLEKALAFKEMSIEERESMEAELDAIKKLLAKNEEALVILQKENRRTASVAGLCVFACIAIFLIYNVVVNAF